MRDEESVDDEAMVQVVVLPEQANRKRFQLCIGIYRGETRLEHEDYPVTKTELMALRDRIDRAFSLAEK